MTTEDTNNNQAELAGNVEAPKTNDKEFNFERLRKKVDDQDKALSEQNNKISQYEGIISKQTEMLEKMQSAFAPANSASDSFSSIERLDPDDLISKNHLDAYTNNIINKVTEQVSNMYKKQQEDAYVEKINTKYPDYNEIVSDSAIQNLSDNHPEFSQAVAEVKDNFKRREMVYKFIKKNTEQKNVQQHANQNAVNRNYYNPGFGHVPSAGQSGQYFDPNNRSAVDKAYQQLKKAQGGLGRIS